MGKKKFLLYGLNRLTLGVAAELIAHGSRVVVLRAPDTGELAERLDARVEVVIVEPDLSRTFKAVDLSSADCLLALHDDDILNLHATLTAHDVAPHVPVVVRSFDPSLADDLEQGLNIRRSYSVSALSAPAFVAAVLADEMLETLKLGTDRVLVCRLSMVPDSPLRGGTVADVARQHACTVVACRKSEADRWRESPPDDTVLIEGMQLVLGGLLHDVLHLACINRGLPRRRDTSRAARREAARRRRRLTSNLVPVAAITLFIVMVTAILVFKYALNLAWIDALYFVVTTATTTGYGDIHLLDAPAWVKLFGCLVMLSGGALIAVIFSYLAAIITADRLEEQLGRRAQSMSNHIVMAGLGNVGYRVDQLFTDLHLPVVVLERSPDHRFVDAARERAIVLELDSRVAENLELAGIRQAYAFVACTDDDLANIQATLVARRLNPKIYTVARIVDTHLAERLTRAFRIDYVVNPYRAATGAFVGAASDDRAFRYFHLGEVRQAAFLYEATTAVAPERVREWRADGLQVLASCARDGRFTPASAFSGETPRGLHSGELAIMAGPFAAAEKWILADAPLGFNPR